MPNSRRRLVGRVVSDKMEKTVVVAIERRKAHRVYKKVIRSTKKVMAHDESNAVEIGSVVQLVESKPISKNKRWMVEKVLEGPGGRVLEPLVGDTPAGVGSEEGPAPEVPPAGEASAAAGEGEEQES
ncbi:MAG: 30S ribosomal protein S17 [Chloroflexi bacterium]|nr:30S ribosomal protein S17 [Chloroflexota bacterium]